MSAGYGSIDHKTRPIARRRVATSMMRQVGFNRTYEGSLLLSNPPNIRRYVGDNVFRRRFQSDFFNDFRYRCCPRFRESGSRRPCVCGFAFERGYACGANSLVVRCGKRIKEINIDDVAGAILALSVDFGARRTVNPFSDLMRL